MSVTRSVARSVVRAVASSVTVPGDGGGGGPSYDSNAQDFFARAEAGGGSFDLTSIDPVLTESYVKSAWSACIAGLKADGVWSKITEFVALCGVTYPGISHKVKYNDSATFSAVNFVAGDLAPAGVSLGLTDKATAYIDQLWAPADTHNITTGVGATFWVEFNGGTTNGRLWGTRPNGDDEFRVITTSTPSINCFASTVLISSAGTGCFTFNMKEGEQRLYEDSIEVIGPATRTGLSMPAIDNYLLGINGLTGDATNRMSFFLAHDYLDATDAGYVYNRLSTLRTALGGT